jgi:hypothetical protein
MKRILLFNLIFRKNHKIFNFYLKWVYGSTKCNCRIFEESQRQNFEFCYQVLTKTGVINFSA